MTLYQSVMKIYLFIFLRHEEMGDVDFVSGQIGWHLNKMTCICKEILGLHKGMVTPHLPSPSPVSPPPYLYSFQSADQWVTNTCIGNTSSVFQEYKYFMSLCKHGNSTIQYSINFLSHPPPPRHLHPHRFPLLVKFLRWRINCVLRGLNSHGHFLKTFLISLSRRARQRDKGKHSIFKLKYLDVFFTK